MQILIKIIKPIQQKQFNDLYGVARRIHIMDREYKLGAWKKPPDRLMTITIVILSLYVTQMLNLLFLLLRSKSAYNQGTRHTTRSNDLASANQAQTARAILPDGRTEALCGLARKESHNRETGRDERN